MHLLVEFLFTLTRVFLAVWTDLPILSLQGNLCQHTAIDEPNLPRVKRGRRKGMMGKSSQKTSFDISAFNS